MTSNTKYNHLARVFLALLYPRETRKRRKETCAQRAFRPATEVQFNRLKFSKLWLSFVAARVHCVLCCQLGKFPLAVGGRETMALAETPMRPLKVKSSKFRLILVGVSYPLSFPILQAKVCFAPTWKYRSPTASASVTRKGPHS